MYIYHKKTLISIKSGIFHKQDDANNQDTYNKLFIVNGATRILIMEQKVYT